MINLENLVQDIKSFCCCEKRVNRSTDEDIESLRYKLYKNNKCTAFVIALSECPDIVIVVDFVTCK